MLLERICRDLSRLALTVVVVIASCSSSVVASTIVHYDFTDGIGTVVSDLTSNNNDGTYIPDGASTSAGAGMFDVSEGWIAGGGINFLWGDGQRSYVDTNVTINTLQGSDFTVEVVANLGSYETNYIPMVGSSNPAFSGTQSVFIGVDNEPLGTSKELNIRFGPGIDIGTSTSPWNADATTSDPTFHHIAVVFDTTAKTAETYIDGSSIGVTNHASFDDTSTETFILANTGWGPNEQWDGTIAGFALSDTKLVPSRFVLAVPEPSSVIVAMMGIGSLLYARRQR